MRALYTLDFFCSRLRSSISRSYRRWPSTRATRTSSGWLALINILFMWMTFRDVPAVGHGVGGHRKERARAIWAHHFLVQGLRDEVLDENRTGLLFLAFIVPLNPECPTRSRASSACTRSIKRWACCRCSDA